MVHCKIKANMKTKHSSVNEYNKLKQTTQRKINTEQLIACQLEKIIFQRTYQKSTYSLTVCLAIKINTAININGYSSADRRKGTSGLDTLLEFYQ